MRARARSCGTARDCRASDGHYKNGAPRVGDGLVFTGASGSEFGARGYVSAYRAATGALVWRFYTVPKRGETPHDPALVRAAATWHFPRPEGPLSGGTVWDAMTYDPSLKMLYIGTGGAFPQSYQERSPNGGDELFLESIVALDARTGRYVWHYQTTPQDNYDYNAANHLMLADLDFRGQPRKVLMTAPKNGYFYVLDRRTGEFIDAKPFARANWTTGLDPLTGRPTWNAAALRKISRRAAVRRFIPANAGAHTWTPMSYDPGEHLVYLPVANVGVRRCSRAQVSDAATSVESHKVAVGDANVDSTYVIDDTAAAPGEIDGLGPGGRRGTMARATRYRL